MPKWITQGVSIRDIVWFLILIIGFVYGYATLEKEVSLNTEYRQDRTYERDVELFVTRKEYADYKKDVIDRIFNEIEKINTKLDAMK